MNDCGNHNNEYSTRRDFLNDFGWGIGGLSLASILGVDPTTAEAVSPLAAKSSHFPVKAKAVIQLFASLGQQPLRQM